MEGLDVVNRLRKTQKGSDVPLVILTNEEMRGTHIITYQEQAQEMILGTDSVTTLKQKLEALSSDTAQVSGHDLASEVSYESLSAMVLLEDQAVARYPSLVQHLSDLLGSPIQPEASQVLAIRTLRKMGKIAAPSVHVLLDLLDGEASVEYKLVVLHALLSVSDANAEVKAKLYEIMVDASSPQSFRQMAATYLSAHQADLTPEERHVFQQSFFTSAFGAELSR
jgi:CheY-like chemotaxis protein